MCLLFVFSVVSNFNVVENARREITCGRFRKKIMDHSKEFEELVAVIMPEITEITVEETLAKQASGTILVDVREDNEWEAGHAKDAVHIGRGVIERDIIHQFPKKGTEIILYCGGGYRSALAADNLQKMGYRNILSMKGGWTAWNEKNAPIE